MSNISTEQIRAFKEAVGMASWNLDLWRFAVIIDQDPSYEYTQNKFKELATLSKALSRFDAETLAKIVNATKEN